MKFFKTKSGIWLNLSVVKYFRCKNRDAYAVLGHVYNEHQSFTADEILIGKFNSHEDAEAYIDEIVSKINQEEISVNPEKIADDFADNFVNIFLKHSNNPNSDIPVGDPPWNESDRISCS